MNTNPTFERTALVTMREPRVRRVGRGVAMLRLLVLSALCGWAWSAAKGEMAAMTEMVELKTEKGGTENGWTMGEALTMVTAVTGLVGVITLVLAAQRRQNSDLAEAYAKEDPYAGDGREDPMRVLLRRHGIAVVTTFDLETLRDLACSEQSLLAVDRFMRWRWKKVLFMTSLMEMVALAGRLSETRRQGDHQTIRQSDTETQRKGVAARWTVGPLESLGEDDCIDPDDRNDGFQVSLSHGLRVSKSGLEGRGAA